MTEERINELMENEEFVAGAKELQSIDEAVEYLASYGVEVTADELTSASTDSTDGELSEDALDNVTGGCFRAIWNWFYNWIHKSNRDCINEISK